MPVRLGKANSDRNVWITNNDYMRTLMGAQEFISVELNGNNPPTVKQYTRFSIYKTDNSYTISDQASTGNNSYPAGTTPTYLLAEAVYEDSADRTFAWGSGNFPAQSDGTWYLYCTGSNDTDVAGRGKGIYGASKTETPSLSRQKGGYYSSSGYRILASFDSASGVVSNLVMYAFNFPYNDGTANQYLATDGAGTLSWATLPGDALTVETKTADYTLTSSDTSKLIIANPNTVSQYGTLEIELPLGGSSVKGIEYIIEHGSNQGLVKIVVNSGGSDKIRYKNDQLDYVLLHMQGSKVVLVWNDTEFSVLQHDFRMKINFQNRSDWQNVHVGNAVTYDTKSAAVDLTGMVITESTSGFTGVIVYDSGGTGTSGIFYVYDLSSSFTYWTNNRTLTASDGTTALVNESSGDSKDVDYNLYHGFGTNINNIKYTTIINSSASFTDAFMVDFVDTNNGATRGATIFQVSTSALKIQVGAEGYIYSRDSDGGNVPITTQDWYIYQEVIF